MTTKYPGRIHAPSYILNDAIEALVQVTAHEVAHIEQHRDGLKVHREAWIDSLGIKVLEAFRGDRETLLAAWSVPVIKRVTVKAGPVEKRAARVSADLERWQRKLKLAQTKIRKLKQRARYYDRKQAAKRVES